MWTEILLVASLWGLVGAMAGMYAAIKAAAKGEAVKEAHVIPFIIMFTFMGPMIFVVCCFLEKNTRS